MRKRLTPAMRRALVALSNTGAYVQASAIFGPRIVGAIPTANSAIHPGTLKALTAQGLVAKRTNTITDDGRKALLEN